MLSLFFPLIWGGEVVSGHGPEDHLEMISITQAERKTANFLTGLKTLNGAECVNANSALGKMPEYA